MCVAVGSGPHVSKPATKFNFQIEIGKVFNVEKKSDGEMCIFFNLYSTVGFEQVL